MFLNRFNPFERRKQKQHGINDQLSRPIKSCPPSQINVTGTILHGASCSGKTHLLNQIKKTRSTVTYVEMDQAKYWIQHEMRARLRKFEDWFDAWSCEHQYTYSELYEHIQASTPSTRLTKLILIKVCLNGVPFVATCGNLPGPDGSFYKILGNIFKLDLTHILISPPKIKFLKQLDQRNRQDRQKKFLSNYDSRLKSRDEYDRVLINADEIRLFIAKISKT